MKFLKDILLNPLWLFEATSKPVIGQILGSVLGGVGTGVGSSLLGGLFQDDVDLPKADDPREIARRGVDIRRDLFPDILKLRSEVDPQFLEADRAQTQRAIDAQRNFLGGDILQSIRDQRGTLFRSDMEQFTDNLSRSASPFREGLLKVSPELQFSAQGVERDQNLLNILRDQLETDLPLQGALDARGRRAVEQATGSNIGRRGRGALFGLGQLALNTEEAERGREAFNLSKLFNTVSAGGQVDQRGLAVSDRFTSPFLNILSQNQAANRALVGSPLQNLQFAQQTARAGTPNIPVFDQSLLGLESLRLNQGLGQGKLDAAANQDRLGLFEGGFSGGLDLFGSIFKPKQEPVIQRTNIV